MYNKRGQQLSTNTIIVVILAVLVLIVVAVFFTGGFGSFVSRITSIWSTTGQDANEIALKCNADCNNFENTGLDAYMVNYCNKEYDLDIDGDKKVDQVVTCQDLPRVACRAVSDAGGC